MVGDRSFVGVAFLACALWASSAEAQPTISETEARADFTRGVALYEASDFEGAAVAFERASRGLQTPAVRLNLAVALEKSGRRVKALKAYERLLADPGNLSSERIERARQAQATLDGSLSQLRITCATDGVLLSGPEGEIGRTPIAGTVRVEPGTVFVHASLEGFEPRIIPVVGRAKQIVDVVIEMIPTDAMLGEIAFTSRLRGAKVFLDGREVGLTPLSSTLAVRAGAPHRLEVRREGYLTESAQITVEQGATARVDLTPRVDEVALRDLGAQVRLAIRQDGAVVRVDGDKLVDPRVVTLPPGVHEIVVSRERYESVLRVVELRGSTPMDLSIDLAPTPEHRVELRDEARSVQTTGIALTVAGSVLVAGSVGVLVGARVHGASVDADRDAFDARKAPYEDCPRMGYAKYRECVEADAAILADEDLVTGLTIGGAVGIPVGVAGVVTGVVLLVAGDDPDRYELPPLQELGDVRVVPLVEGGPAGFRLGLGGSF